LKEFLIGSKGIFEEQSGNNVSNHEHTSVGRVFVFLHNNQVRVFEFFRTARGLVFIFLGDLKNYWGPGLRKPKRSSYEIRTRVRVHD
jgi:hypothetical protein